MLDFRIVTFLTVCNTRNYTRAAEQLHITQPAVSQHIRYLEETYGTKLFCSEGRRLTLTPEGEVLRRTAAAMRNDELLMRERLRTGANGELPLHFGVTMTVGEFLIARPLSAYLLEHPGADVRMEMGNTEELLGKLRRGELYFALVEGYFDRTEFDSALYQTERFLAVCAANHRFACPPTALRDLLRERVLARESGSGTRDILEKHLAAQNMALSDFADIVQISGMQAILQLLERDVGISFLYEAVARKGIQSCTLREIPLRDFQVEHDIALIWERGSVFAGEYQDLCRQLLKADEA